MAGLLPLGWREDSGSPQACQPPCAGGAAASGVAAGMTALGQELVEARIDPPGIALEDLVAVAFAEMPELVDVALGVVVIVPGLGIDSLDGADHLRREQDV